MYSVYSRFDVCLDKEEQKVQDVQCELHDIMIWVNRTWEKEAKGNCKDYNLRILTSNKHHLLLNQWSKDPTIQRSNEPMNQLINESMIQ